MPARPPLHSELESAPSGAIVDPHTGDRVIAASRRKDGTVRKEIRLRPGFTPVEDQAKFRSARQQDSDARALPKGSVVGMIRPEVAAARASLQGLSAAQKKNAKRKEKRKEESKSVDRRPGQEDEEAPDNWDSEEEEGVPEGGNSADEVASGLSKSTGDSTVVSAQPSTIPEPATSTTTTKAKASTPAKPPPPRETAGNPVRTNLFNSALKSASASANTSTPASKPTSNAAPPPASAASSKAKSAVENTSSPRKPPRSLFGHAMAKLDTPDESSDPAKRARNLRKKITQAQQLAEKQQKGEKLLPEQAEKVAGLEQLESELASLGL